MAPEAGASWLKQRTDATAASKHNQRALLHGLQGQQAVCVGDAVFEQLFLVTTAHKNCPHPCLTGASWQPLCSCLPQP